MARVCHPQYESFYDRRTGISFEPEVVNGRVVAVADVPASHLRDLLSRGFHPLDPIPAPSVPPPAVTLVSVGGGYYDLTRDGEVLERVRGRLAAEARATEIIG